MEVLESMLEPSRGEPGCLSYRFFVAPDDPDHILFFEEWKDEQAVEEHFASPHFQELGERLEGLLAQEPTINVYEANLAHLGGQES